VEADDVDFIAQSVYERRNLSSRLWPGAQQRPHCFAADALVAIVKSCFLEGGAKLGEYPPKFPGQVTHGRRCLSTHVRIGVS
jgi:hypothetical protein